MFFFVIDVFGFLWPSGKPVYSLRFNKYIKVVFTGDESVEHGNKLRFRYACFLSDDRSSS